MSLTMQDSVFYLAEILVAMQQLHDRNIIYRDLKPENILLDQHGHIKLIDFGFSKQMANIKKGRVRTNCGTPAYAAPEVLIGGGYGYKADVWSFGILICELLGGFTPFGNAAMQIGVAQEGLGSHVPPSMAAMPPQQIVEMVNSGRIILPKNLTAQTRDLVKKILVADPGMRLEIKGIMQHKFFEGVDWEAVARKQLPPPYVPAKVHIAEQTGLMEDPVETSEGG
jgi:serine/threonine protein kinase